MKTPVCLYSYPAGVRRTTEIGPTGECLHPPVGAFLGQLGSIWYHCEYHRRWVVDTITEHCDTRDFPLTAATVEEAQVYEVMIA